MSVAPLLAIHGLSKVFNDVPVVDRVDLAVTQGEIVMIIGPSGAGLVPDKPVATANKRRRIGMVFQRFNLFAHLSALDNVAIGPRRVLGMKSTEARALAAG
jgi:glutamate transport system ATP-binding protein